MPVFVLYTNLSADKVNDGFLTSTSKLIAKVLDKPEKYVCVRVNTDQKMIFDGTNDPCAHVELESLGKVGKNFNETLVPCIGKHIEDNLGIPQDRFYIKTINIARPDLGWNGKPFE